MSDERSTPPPTPSLPPPGWFSDPEDPAMQRWWDGTSWTEHRQRSESLGPPSSSSIDGLPSGLPARDSRLLGRNAVIIATLILLASIAVAGYLLAGGSSSDEQRQADALAKEQVLTAQVAMEIYATENNGSYASATVEDLREIESLIPEALEIEFAEETAYVLTVESEDGGNVFGVENDDGRISHPCSSSGEGGCPSSGQWN